MLTVTHQYLYLVKYKFCCWKKYQLFLKNHSPTRAEKDFKKIEHFFVYCNIYVSLNISIDWSKPTCMYRLRVSRGPHNFSLGLALVELVKKTW